MSKSPSTKQDQPELGDDFARRVRRSDVRRRLLTRPLLIRDGERGLLIQDGAYTGRIEPGEHDLGGPLRQWFVGDGPAEIIVTRVAPKAIAISIKDLDTAEGLGVTLELTCPLVVSDERRFATETMAGRERLSDAELARMLTPALTETCARLAAHHGHDQLVNADPPEDALRCTADRLEDASHSMGLRCVAPPTIRFTSAVREAVREVRADAVIAAEAARADHVRLEAEADRNLLEAKAAQDLIDYAEQRRLHRDAATIDDALALEQRRREFEREQRLLEAKTDQDERAFEVESDLRELELARRLQAGALESRRRLRGNKPADNEPTDNSTDDTPTDDGENV